MVQHRHQTRECDILWRNFERVATRFVFPSRQYYCQDHLCNFVFRSEWTLFRRPKLPMVNTQRRTFACGRQIAGRICVWMGNRVSYKRMEQQQLLGRCGLQACQCTSDVRHIQSFRNG